MRNFQKNTFQKMLLYGSSPEMNHWEVRRIRLLNLFYFVSNISFLIGIIETYLVEGTQNGNLIVELALTFQIGLVLLFLRKTKWAEFYFLLMINFTLFIFENLYGPEGGTYLYYFPFFLMVAFLVDFRKLWHALLHITISMSFIFIGIILRHQFLYKVFSQDILLASFNSSFIISSLVTAFVAFIIGRMSYDQYLQFRARIEERQANEEQMKNSIREKETLLAEVHHRVKNNLSVITSLLNLQMNQVDNDYTRDVLRECRNRVSSMALIHQKLYKNLNIEQIDFGSYAAELVQEIKSSYRGDMPNSIQVVLDVEHIALSLTKAVPCGLILNELLSNCYKHAFPQKKEGEIFIRFKKHNAECEMEVEDNGVGLSTDFLIEKQDTLGMTIIQSLTEQIDGQIKVSKNEGKGTIVKITFLS